jgi:Methyltransferase domain
MRLHGLVWLLVAGCLGTAQAQEEAPFITTPDRVTLAMLEMAQVKPGEHVIDLGSGDGRIVITAARRFKATGLGVEIDPALVLRSRDNAQRAGVAPHVQFREQDLFLTDLAPADVITIYLLPQLNLQLRPRLLMLKPGTRIVSHDWDMGDWLPDQSLTLDVPEKAIGREKKSTVYLWRVPASVHGLWCGPGVSLAVTQRFSQLSGTLQRTGDAAPAMVFDARLNGVEGQVQTPHAGLLRVQGDTLLVRGLGSSGGAAMTATFTRAKAATCPGP